MSLPAAILAVFLLFAFCFFCVVVAVSFGFVGCMVLIMVMGMFCCFFTENA